MKIVQTYMPLNTYNYTESALLQIADRLGLEVLRGGGIVALNYNLAYETTDAPDLIRLRNAAKSSGVDLKRGSLHVSYEKSDFEAAPWLYFEPPLEDDERGFYGRVIAGNPFPSLALWRRPADDSRPYVVDAARLGRKHALEDNDTVVISDRLKKELEKAGVQGAVYIEPEIKAGKPGSCWILSTERHLDRLAARQEQLDPENPFRTLYAEDVEGVDIVVIQLGGSYEIYISQKFYKAMSKVVRGNPVLYPLGVK